ncbi:MAG: 30S ribosomal protein S17e [DPANN group archaeon]|nr:30S ribosomal protein S17e [DPANN group archaeon]
MGRIKTVPIKSKTFDIFEKHGDILSDKYEENKAKLPTLATIKSKKLRNVVSGYITRLHKRRSKEDQ